MTITHPAAELSGEMIVFCAWCNRQTGTKKCVASAHGTVSHGICRDCLPALLGDNCSPEVIAKITGE